MDNEKRSIQLQLLNEFNGGKTITWDDLLKIMSTRFHVDRDKVFENMNELIDAGMIVVPRPEVYSRPGASGKNTGTGKPIKNPFAKETLNLTEQARILREDPAMYETLKNEAPAIDAVAAK